MVHFGSKKAGSGFGARMTAVCIGLFALCAVWMLFRILPYHTSDQYIGQAVPVTVISSAEITVNGEITVLSASGGSVVCKIKEGRIALDKELSTKIFVA